MRTVPGAEQKLAGLLAVETYRSIWLPTTRLGRPAVVAISSPLSIGDASRTEMPTHWFAATPDRDDLLVFARTEVVTPVSDFRPGPVEVVDDVMHPRDAHRLLRDQLPVATADFLASRASDQASRDQVRAAIEATVPLALWPWFSRCCADFVTWLGSAPDPEWPS